MARKEIPVFCMFFFFNDTATTEIYTLSLHDALPIPACGPPSSLSPLNVTTSAPLTTASRTVGSPRSEEHTSELQSHHDLVCRLLLEKKKKKIHTSPNSKTIQQNK